MLVLSKMKSEMHVGSWNHGQLVLFARWAFSIPTRDSTSQHVTQYRIMDRCHLICDVLKSGDICHSGRHIDDMVSAIFPAKLRTH